MNNEISVKRKNQMEVFMEMSQETPIQNNNFGMLVALYRELQTVMTSVEKVILSHAVINPDDTLTKETLAREIWDRDYVIYHTRNTHALSVLTNIAVDRHHNQ